MMARGWFADGLREGVRWVTAALLLFVFARGLMAGGAPAGRVPAESGRKLNLSLLLPGRDPADGGRESLLRIRSRLLALDGREWISGSLSTAGFELVTGAADLSFVGRCIFPDEIY